MTRIHFIEHSGRQHDLEAADGQSLMQAAVDHNVPGILGDCGGTCSCATCHAYVRGAAAAGVPGAGEDEQALLEGVLDPRADSRLTCQIVVGPALAGLVVRLPAP